MTAPPPDPTAAQQAVQVLALVEAQAAARELLTGQLTDLVRTAAAGFTAWYDHQRITAWSKRLAGDTEPILRLLARNTDAYQARILSVITSRRIRPVGTVDVSALRQGITHAGAYARATDVYRWQQSQLDSAARTLLTVPDPRVPDLQTPLQAAVQRATDVAEMDTQLAVREQSRRNFHDAHQRGVITGWRRVIHPELSNTGTCGLCIAASDRLYSPRQPMPLHEHCNCVPMPVYDRKDPGSALNAADLQRLYDEAGSTSRAELKATRYQVNEHGELGPLLSPRTGKPRGPRTVKRDTGPPATPKTPEQLAADLRRVRDTLTPALDKARELAAANPKKWSRYLTQLEARIADLDAQLAA